MKSSLKFTDLGEDFFAHVKTQKLEIVMKHEIKGKGTYPEKLIRRILTDQGIRYKLNVKSLPGKPDILIKGTKKIEAFSDFIVREVNKEKKD